MDKKTEHEKYREIACEAIKQGIEDYLTGRDSEDELRSWIDESSLFDYLGLNREWFINKAIELRSKNVKSIKNVCRRGYGKKF